MSKKNKTKNKEISLDAIKEPIPQTTLEINKLKISKILFWASLAVSIALLPLTLEGSPFIFFLLFNITTALFIVSIFLIVQQGKVQRFFNTWAQGRDPIASWQLNDEDLTDAAQKSAKNMKKSINIVMIVGLFLLAVSFFTSKEFDQTGWLLLIILAAVYIIAPYAYRYMIKKYGRTVILWRDGCYANGEILIWGFEHYKLRRAFFDKTARVIVLIADSYPKSATPTSMTVKVPLKYKNEASDIISIYESQIKHGN